MKHSHYELDGPIELKKILLVLIGNADNEIQIDSLTISK